MTFLVALQGVAGARPLPREWRDVRSWVLQMEQKDLEDLSRCGKDLIVIDDLWDRLQWLKGEEPPSLTPSEVSRIQSQGSLLVAQLSIGEAEEFRFYWKAEWPQVRPPWLRQPDPIWPGVHGVAFWDPAWQEILLGRPNGYLERLLAKGYDGVYLVGLQQWQLSRAERAEADQDLIDLIRGIAARGRELRPEFGVLLQDAGELLERPELLEAIDGACTQFVYHDLVGNPRHESNTIRLEAGLKRLRQSGRLALALEYSMRPERVRFVKERAAALGVIPIFTTPELDRIHFDP